MTTDVNAAAYQWDAELYQNSHNYVYEYGKEVIQLLKPKKGEFILDLGCGTGQLTSEIAKSGADVIGIDASENMIKEAKENWPGLDFRKEDARDFDLQQEFDGVFSNAVLHWIRPPEAVVHCVSKALKPGGRFVVEFGGKNNIRKAHTALEDALSSIGKYEAAKGQNKYFPSIGEYAPVLEASGLEVLKAWLFDRHTPLENGEDGLRNWYTQFTADLLEDLSIDEKEVVFQQAEKKLKSVLYNHGQWFMDYRRIRIVAVKAK